MQIQQPAAIYVAKPEFMSELCEELDHHADVHGDLVFSSLQKPDVCFALDIWYEPQVVHFESISEAARILRQAGKYWYLHPLENVRRSRLIEAELRKLPQLLTSFPRRDELPEIGCFTLLDKNTLVFSAKRWKPWPLGHCYYHEDKQNPPNRAYLKLWEALTLLRQYPQRGETALDLGASPGGWTYVMQSLGAQVTAVDKAALDPNIAKLKGVSFLGQSAFAIDPEQWPQQVDWVLSDIACYPERTLELVQKWIASGKAKQIIFTIKLQGKTDFAILKKFNEIPGSRTLHMFYNKHEATFFYPAPACLIPAFG